MKTLVVLDSSTLILLQKIQLLDILEKRLDIIIPPKVYQASVVMGKQKKLPDAYLLESKVAKTIKIRKVKHPKRALLVAAEFGLGSGESEAITLCLQEQANALAVDDRKAINVCKAYGIPFISAMPLVVSAYENKMINQDKAESMIHDLAIFGRYKHEIIRKALATIGDAHD